MDINIIEPLQIRHKEVMQKAEDLQETVNNLVYEGKFSLGKNLIKIDEIIKYFRTKLFPHMNFDENCVFPFVKSHIPKYEPTLNFLMAEHRELRENFAKFEELYKELVTQENEECREKVIDKLRYRGIYLFCLIRNHFQTEDESIHKAILEHLDNDEKEKLFSKILQCECAQNYIYQKNRKSSVEVTNTNITKEMV